MFNIEEKMEAIPDVKTKKLFEEVYSSYQHGNYRSAIVMLWSVVIADIIFKLKFLEDVYRNKKAILILKEIKEKQLNHPENPVWEMHLLTRVNQELQFITSAEKDNLEYLHKQRNLSAHPVLTDDNLLLAPNKDTTRSLIRNAMEGILLKTALLHSELVDTIVNDLEINKERLGGLENLKPYIQKRYFPNMSNGGAIKLLKALWRFIFDPRNEIERDNIEINFNALLVFFERYKDLFINEISSNSSYYQVSSNYIEKLILFLGYVPEIFNALEESVKTLISSSIKNDLNKFMISDYISPNLETHYKTVLSRLEENEYLRLNYDQIQSCYNKAKDNDILNIFIKICIKTYSMSLSFDAADFRYQSWIHPFLKEFDLNDIMNLMKITNDKSQVCNRGKALDDHKNILNRFDELGGNYSQIENLENWKKWYNYYTSEINRREC